MQLVSHLVALAAVVTAAAAYALPPNRTLAHVVRRADGSEAGIRLPLYRRDHPGAPRGNRRDHVVSHEWLMYEANKLRIKHSGKHRNGKGAHQKRQAAALADYGMDSFYFAAVGIGTPKQDFNLILDTGSADMWVAASECSSDGCPPSINKFDSSKSKTIKKSSGNFQVSYGTGAITDGRLVADTVSLANFTIDSLTFAEALGVQKHTISAPASGIMGLGFESLSSSGATPFWQVLMIQNKVEERLFSFQLAYNIHRAKASDDINPGGIFTLGVLDKSQYSGDINWVEVPKRYGNTGIGYWAIPLDDMKINGHRVPLGNSRDAVIDTGTTLIGGPPEIVHKLYSMIRGAQPMQNSQGYYMFPCNAEVKLTLKFGGQEYVIDEDNLNIGTAGPRSSMCVGAVFVQQTGRGMPAWIVGDSFLKTVFSVYRYSPQSVGFASLKHKNAQTLPLEEVNTKSVSSSKGGGFTGAPGGGGGGGGGGGPITITRGSEQTGLQGARNLPKPSVAVVPKNMSVPLGNDAPRRSVLSPTAAAAALVAALVAGL